MRTSRRAPAGAAARTGAAISALVAVLASGCGVFSGESAQETVVIAADLELTGEGSELGAVYRNALELRVEQINQQGLLRDHRLELRVTDNRSDSATAAQNIAALAADESVSAIITGACAECVLAALDTVNNAGVPTIALAAPAAVAEPVQERRYVFKVGPNAKDVATTLARELDRTGAETVAVVTTDDPYGQEGATELDAAMGRFDVEVEVAESIGGGGEQFAAVVDEIVSWTPEPTFDNFGMPITPSNTELDAVVLWGFGAGSTGLIQQLRDAGFDGDLFLDMAAADTLFLPEQGGPVLVGTTMIFTETLVIDELIATSPAKANRKNWVNDYSARYGTYHAYASFAADAVQLVVEAVNQVGSGDRELIRSGIESTRMDGFTGPLRMSPQHHSALMPQALVTLEARGDRWRMAG